MSSERILDDHGNRVGWGVASKLAVALEYIDNQQNEGTFEDFVCTQANEDLANDIRRHKHDCKQCVFLGYFEEYDLYYCPQRHLPTVIARWGDSGAEYLSGLAGAELIPQLAEAKLRAVARGLLIKENP